VIYETIQIMIFLAFKREIASWSPDREATHVALNQPNRASNRAQLPCPNRVNNSGGGQLLPLSYPNLLSSFRALGHNPVNHRWSCEPR
jgi:hypothetical protein